ncbi:MULTISPECIES: hypothetical protein [Corynebacterium]|uniref:Or membrane protein n=1 Tax=Corynebacterium singulare TaxID=161899 RepID=A0A0B6EZB9_9CORY|nr:MULTISPECIES: hypothetical protein [Corynebacterium]AJI78309.1 hypothetical protein CSING_03810 [Corynebacterium singulare]OFT62975.1 hypothetical protein HMPREF3149_02045 [Corynebacterium sp. HMSC05E07]
MKASRLTTLVAAAAVSVAAVAVPTASAQEAPTPVETAVDTTAEAVATTAGATAETTTDADKLIDADELTEPDPNIAEQPTTPWLRILEGSSAGPVGVIITILFGIISLGMAAYQQFGEYLPKLG